ncbi:MAG: response regulator [Proteobacteria bacterium]|nr:response regulator [Pseudomonadota bacterium]MBU1585512.1 response regulator [Pseudomonadota bacterium]MBU2456203.1 response regulator [Pseudomonadota bacterium]
MSKKILIVDDEPNIIVPLEFLMEQNNYEVKVAENGEQALDFISTFGPDLILLDIMLPGIDGYEVCQKIRKNPKFKHIKIVFLSAMARTIDIAKGMGLAADDYITKPFSNSYVVERVGELLKEEK